MEVGDRVMVTCSDTGAEHQGVVERAGRELIAVSINPRAPLITLRKSRGNLWIGNAAGLEFTVIDSRKLIS